MKIIIASKPTAMFALACLAWGRPACAQNEPDGDPALMVGRVEIGANKMGALPTRSVLSSVDILGDELLRDQQVKSAWELFSRAPGVMLTPFRQGNESGKLSFRGFNGEGEVNAVKLLIDGIPAKPAAATCWTSEMLLGMHSVLLGSPSVARTTTTW